MRGKKFWLIGSIVVVALILMGGYWNMMKSTEKQEQESQIVDKAKEIAIDYFKKKHSATVEFTRYQIPPTYVGNEVALYGYLNGQKDQDFMILIDSNDFKVIEAAVPPELNP